MLTRKTIWKGPIHIKSRRKTQEYYTVASFGMKQGRCSSQSPKGDFKRRPPWGRATPLTNRERAGTSIEGQSSSTSNSFTQYIARNTRGKQHKID